MQRFTFSLTLCFCLFLVLPGIAQEDPPSIKSLFNKYKQLESGKVVFNRTSYSASAIDSITSKTAVVFQKYDAKARNYKGYNIYYQSFRASYSSQSLKFRDSIYQFSDTFVRRSAMDETWARRSIRSPFYGTPLINPNSFFRGDLAFEKLKLESENKSFWNLQGKEISLRIRKSDSLITRIEWREETGYNDMYWRVDFLEQQYGITFMAEENPFDPAKVLRNHKTRPPLTEPPKYPSMVGQAAPPWKLPNLIGDSISLADFRGQYVLLDFWFIGCLPCVRAIPEIQALSDKFDPEQVKVISIELYQKDTNQVQGFMEKKAASYEVLLAKSQSKIPRSYGVHSAPTFFLINPEGVIEHSHVGFSPGRMKKLEKMLMRELADE